MSYAVDLIGRAGGAQDVVGGDAPALAGELIATARPADAFENAVAHEGLENGLEMPRRQAMARGQGFGGDGATARIEGDVDDGGDGQNAFARQERHGSLQGRGAADLWYHSTTAPGSSRTAFPAPCL